MKKKPEWMVRPPSENISYTLQSAEVRDEKPFSGHQHLSIDAKNKLRYGSNTEKPGTLK